jgi:hypothetical protein
MRKRIRFQPYIAHEVLQKLRAYAAAENVTESAVAEAALTEFLQRGAVDEPLLMSRLAALGEDVARLQRDLDVLSVSFATLARYVLVAAQPSPGPDAKRRGAAMYDVFLKSTAAQLDAGVRLVGEVSRAGSRARGTAMTQTGQGGGKENSAPVAGEAVR